MAIDVLDNADLSKYAQPGFKDGEAWDLLSKYGNLETFTANSGDLVTVMPSLSVPTRWFDKGNWRNTIPMGNFRTVNAIRVVEDPAKPAIVTKSGERVFTTSPRNLEAGRPWWGGERSGEKPVYIENNPAVEEQVIWEAITLLELGKQGVRAEVPQAILQNPHTGRLELVVKEIPFQREISKTKGPSWDEIFKGIRQSGLVPDDSGGHNCLQDTDGQLVLIDTNRWYWPPYTNGYRERLVNEVAKAANLSSLVPGR